MPRSVNHVASRQRRKKVMKSAKGYFGGNSRVYTVAMHRVQKGLKYAYRDRKNRKREFRKLWIQRINAGVRELGYSYSDFMGKFAKSDLDLNRKTLADLAMNQPEAFKKVVQEVME